MRISDDKIYTYFRKFNIKWSLPETVCTDVMFDVINLERCFFSSLAASASASMLRKHL